MSPLLFRGDDREWERVGVNRDTGGGGGDIEQPDIGLRQGSTLDKPAGESGLRGGGVSGLRTGGEAEFGQGDLK